MATSENGYPVLDPETGGRPPRLRSWVIPTVNRKLLLRDGSVGFLLVHLTLWFDKTLESVDTGGTDDWGYALRRIGGSNKWSNHASGTAIDLNATQHPQGVPTRNTFSVVEINRIHQRLKFYNECIRWGGDYQGTPDGMHFEINRGLDAVERRARKLTKSDWGKLICEANPGVKAFIFG